MNTARIPKLDITKFFSAKLTAILEESFSISKKYGMDSVTPELILFLLLKKLEIKAFINNDETQKSLESYIGELVSKQRTDSKLNGVVWISPELQKVLLVSFDLIRQENRKEVTLKDLFAAFSIYPPFADKFEELGLSLVTISQKAEKEEGFLSRGLEDKMPMLSKYTKDMTSIASRGGYSQIIGREQELSQVSRILARQNKNNVLLVGETGVGKRKIIEGFVNNVVNNEVPSALSGVTVLELDLPGLQSAANSAERFGFLMDAFRNEFRINSKILLFIEDFGSFFKIEESRLLYEIGSLLKPSILSGEIRIISTIDYETYRKSVENDAAYAKVFEVVKVEEPNEAVAVTMVQSAAEGIAKYHGVKIDDESVKSAVYLSKRYITEKRLPEKALDILDEACSKVSLEKRDLVTGEDIGLIISEKTGIPIQKITQSEQSKLVNLEKILSEKVVGQDHAIKIVSESIRRARAGLKDPKKPIGSFLFLGPTGVGKTELAKVLTKTVYDDENAMIRIDMSEFSESHTVQRLVGAPPGYVGYEEGGQLTNPVWERPYSLILLDEIEKAHPKVFDVFLQVLDDGRLTDGKGRTVDFRNTIIIATSNIASAEITEMLEGKDRNQDARELLMPVLMQYFRPEFINRFDAVVAFNPLSMDVMRIIARVHVDKLVDKLEERGIKVVYSEGSVEKIAKESFDPKMGARPLLRYLQQNVENKIAKGLIDGTLDKNSEIDIDKLLLSENSVNESGANVPNATI